MEFSQQQHFSPHTPAQASVSRVMLNVILALIPGIVVYIFYFGWGVLVNIVLASVFALLAESLVLAMRKRPVVTTLFDGSALLTGILLALALPPHSSWWVIAVGVFFAIVIAKQLYGGLGLNPFNPAMTGYVVLLISFPLEMTRWNPPLELAEQSLSLIEAFRYSFNGYLPSSMDVDMISLATPLDIARERVEMGMNLSQIKSEFSIFSNLSGKGTEWINFAFLAGGIWLLLKGLIDWRIPASLLLAMSAIAGVFWLINPEQYLSPLFHLFAGATMLGAFFIATDPVTASTTVRGRLIYGFMIGALVFVIRHWGGYPDGVAFAVLL
ncbi:MAG: electron transport complex subunit RsxD, partial [Gammaproteobacteria bacterium]|nr:electron transport complex subunit RsxD [Gammaproteobacteria bacterium]